MDSFQLSIKHFLHTHWTDSVLQLRFLNIRTYIVEIRYQGRAPKWCLQEASCFTSPRRTVLHTTSLQFVLSLPGCRPTRLQDVSLTVLRLAYKMLAGFMDNHPVPIPCSHTPSCLTVSDFYCEGFNINTKKVVKSFSSDRKHSGTAREVDRIRG